MWHQIHWILECRYLYIKTITFMIKTSSTVRGSPSSSSGLWLLRLAWELGPCRSTKTFSWARRKKVPWSSPRTQSNSLDKGQAITNRRPINIYTTLKLKCLMQLDTFHFWKTSVYFVFINIPKRCNEGFSQPLFTCISF